MRAAPAARVATACLLHQQAHVSRTRRRRWRPFAAVKLLILRGGGARRRGPRQAPQPLSTRERGVLAIEADGHWVLINMSPAVAHQLEADERLERHDGLPDAPVRALVLTDAQVDHVGGLLSLREGAPIDLYATPVVFEELTTSLPVLPVLQHYCGVHWHVVPVAGDRRVAPFQVEGLPSLAFTALAIEAPAPRHSPQHEQPAVGSTIALAVQDVNTGQRLFCAPGLASIGATEFDWMKTADCLLVDGQAVADTAADDAGPAAWVELLAGLPARHKVLLAREEAAPALAGRGIALAYDGMEIEL